MGYIVSVAMVLQYMCTIKTTENYVCSKTQNMLTPEHSNHEPVFLLQNLHAKTSDRLTPSLVI